MKTPFSILALTALLAGWAAAQVPKKAPISRYTGLWTNSPFTSKPPPATPGEVTNPLDDYALLGVSPIKNGYRVTMMEKKAPDKRITIDTDNPKSQYKVLGVSRKPGDPLGTTVRISIGSQTGTISYDEKLLTLVAAPKAAPQPPQPPQPGQIIPPNPNNPQLPQRQPRPRVVPPPNPPGVQPVQPAQPAQPAQPVQQNNQRPERRRN